MKKCTCGACQALNKRYARDPRLLALYRKKLLIRGWAGKTSEIENAYILAHAPWAQALAVARAKSPGLPPKLAVQTAFPQLADLVGAAAKSGAI